MTITPVHEIENNIYKTIIKPSAFGTSTVTSEQELSMLADFPQMLRYADIEFKASFKVVDGTPVISTDEGAVEIKIENLVNKEYKIDENLEIDFEVNADKIATSELDETVLTTKFLVAQAKVLVFETCVMNRIKELMDAARANVNDFEATTEVIL